MILKKLFPLLKISQLKNFEPMPPPIPLSSIVTIGILAFISLGYTDIKKRMENEGVDPPTSRMQSGRSTI